MDTHKVTRRQLSLIIEVLSCYSTSPVKRFLKRRNIIDDLQKCEKDVTMTVEEFNVRVFRCYLQAEL